MENTDPALTKWQSVQASMLYRFASLAYLKLLHQGVTNVVEGVVDPLLDLAKAQNRDSALMDDRWGTRNTSANWANRAWPFLKDFQVSLARDIAQRAIEKYQRTGANDCLRGIDEYSLQWATPQEEQLFQDAIRAISAHACNIDDTLDDYHNSKWNDSGFAYQYPDFAAANPTIPKFRVRTDVVAESHKSPPRTGVYIAQDDPHAALQFAWTGDGGGKLRPSRTFNEIGLDALKAVGRVDLWINDEKMYAFATSKKYAAMFKDEIAIGGRDSRRLASPAVSAASSVHRPCKWYFVEIINGEFQDIRMSDDDRDATERLRVPGGDTCDIAGFYFTPAQANSRRRFMSGETMPVLKSAYGETIWQWDPLQD